MFLLYANRRRRCPLPQVAALKLQAAGASNGEGEEDGAGKTSSTATAADVRNDLAWEAKLAETTKASDEKLASLAARHNETVEVRRDEMR